MLATKSKVTTAIHSSYSPLVPTILPDEFFLGYLGRLSKFNCLQNESDTNEVLKKWLKQAKPELEEMPLVFNLAHTIGVEPHEFIKQHTLTPILRATQSEIDNYLSEYGIKENSDPSIVRLLSSKVFKKAACFCESCVNEDIDYLWFSFWRRSHQLPGIDWCSKHMEPLQEVHDKNAFSKMPSIFLKSGNYRKQSETLSKNNPIILRFAQLIEDALELEIPLDNRISQEILSKKARLIGVKLSETGNTRQLSDLMNEVLPGQWINKYFPRLKKENYGQFISGFDEVLKSSRKGKSYVNTLLAAAVLFDDADEVMHELTSQKYFPFNKANKQDISDQSFINAYVRHRGSYFNMGIEFGKDRRYIFNRARSLGLPSLTGIDPITLKAIEEFYSGSNLVEILSRPNINKEKIGNIIRLSGRQFSSTIKKLDSIN